MSREAMRAIFLSAVALAFGCGEKGVNDDVTDTCPSGTVREGDRCVPSSSREAVPGCTDGDAANYDPTASSDDGSCEYGVAFRVDMGCSGATFTTVYVFGPFNSWCEDCNPLNDSDVDNVWTATYDFAPGNIEYAYGIDGGASQENLADDVANGASCATDTGDATRQVTVAHNPVALSDTYGSCTACPGGTAFDVFTDDYAAGLGFADFDGATNALAIDQENAHSGTASLRIDVPAAGYTGGALVNGEPTDLTGYDAVTFWAKASANATLNAAGLGNDATTSTYQAELNAIPLSTSWTQMIIPIPLANKLTAQTGLFHFAEGADEGQYSIWLDDIRYEQLGGTVIGSPSPAMATETISLQVGDSFSINGTAATFDVNGEPQTVAASPAYFTYTSTDDAIAAVDALAVGRAESAGTAEITAALGGVVATGTLTVNVSQASSPAAPAPAPTKDAANVISLFSSTYTDVSVDTWSAGWDNADVTDEVVGTDTVKLYTNFGIAGIEFTSSPVDATSMTHLHIDIWAPVGDTFRIKLVDFGADGAYDGGDDSEHEIAVSSVDTNAWAGIDLALAEFTNLAERAHLAQMILSGNTSTVYIDNVYFYN